MRSLIRALIAALPLIPLGLAAAVAAAPAAQAEDNGVGLTPTTASTRPGSRATQDAGLFLTSHAAGQPRQAKFNGFTLNASAATPPLATSYQAEAAANTIAGGAGAAACSTCSGGEKVGFVGEGGTLTFNGVAVPAGTYQVTIAYLDGSATGRLADVRERRDGPVVQFTPTGSFSTVGTITIPLTLTAGNNTIEFGNPSAYAPDFDRIIVGAAPS